MTAKKDLKKRVRERMAKTGERYTTALERVRKPSLIEVLPPTHDLGEMARREGFECAAEISEREWNSLEEEEGSAETWMTLVFETLRKLLVSSIGTPGPDRMRRILVHREPIASWPTSLMFLRQVDAGHRGVSPDGLFAAFDVPRKGGRSSLVFVWTLGRRPNKEPFISFGIDPDTSWVRPERLARGLEFMQKMQKLVRR